MWKEKRMMMIMRKERGRRGFDCVYVHVCLGGGVGGGKGGAM